MNLGECIRHYREQIGMTQDELARADLEDFRFHDLRHTCASYLAMSGCSLREIAEVLGHKTLEMSMRYAHLTASHTAALVENMAKKFIEFDGLK